MEPPPLDAPMTCSCSRSPPFRTVRELSTFCLISSFISLSHSCQSSRRKGSSSSSPPFRLTLTTLVRARGVFAIPAHHHWGWPWSENFLFSLHLYFPLLVIFSPSLAAPRAIPSDSDPKWSSACRFSAGCCHGTVQSDLLYPSLLKKTRAPSERPPLAFSRSSLDSLRAGFLFFFLILDVALLHTQPSHLRDRQVTRVLEEGLVSFFCPPSLFCWRASGLLLEGTTLSSPHLFPPCAASFSQVLLWSSFSRCLLTGCHWLCLRLPPLGRLPYGGLAGPRYLLEKNIWEDSECWLAACSRLLFHSVSQSPGLVKLLALSNQQACVRPCCFTGRPRPLGTGFFNGSMVLSFDLLLPPLRFLTYGFLATGSPRLTALFKLLCHRQSSPVSYPFFPILALHQFWPHRLLPLTASD